MNLFGISNGYQFMSKKSVNWKSLMWSQFAAPLKPQTSKLITVNVKIHFLNFPQFTYNKKFIHKTLAFLSFHFVYVCIFKKETVFLLTVSNINKTGREFIYIFRGKVKQSKEKSFAKSRRCLPRQFKNLSRSQLALNIKKIFIHSSFTSNDFFPFYHVFLLVKPQTWFSSDLMVLCFFDIF